MLEAIVARTPREKLMDFPVLTAADHQLIGAFIQEFNYMGFNLRRAVETFAYAKLLSQRAGGRYLAPGNVKQAILDLADLRLVFEQIAQIELWLAKKVFDWHVRYVGA